MKSFKFFISGEFNVSIQDDKKAEHIASQIQSEIFRVARKEAGGVVAFNGVKVEAEEI